MSRRRVGRTEPARCICEPGPDAHPQHGKPRYKRAAHNNPACPHWCPESSGMQSTAPRVTPKTRRLRRITEEN
jgi:hypothetical protein